MIKLPQNNQWKQPNSSYKMGTLWYTKNINLDEEGIIKMSPRTVNIFDSSETTANIGSTNFDIPSAFGRYSDNSFRVVTNDEPFDVSLAGVTKSISENTESNNPNLTTTSHGVWWQGDWYTSTSTTVTYYDTSADDWASSAPITSLSASVRHYMTVFKNKNSLAVSNGNTVKLYNTSHSNTVTLTLPADFEVIGLAYNYYKIGIITRLGTDLTGQNSNSFFFTWDGASSEAGTGVDIGAYTAISIVPYKSSFVVLTGEGQLLYWNGGGFDVLASFPFYFTQNRFSGQSSFQAYGDIMLVDGDTILINVGFELDSSNYKGDEYVVNNPSGVWCFDPSVGLYHKYSPSISRTYNHWITTGNVNTTTDIITTTNTIPATGNPLMISGLNGSLIGGITNRKIYYLIKLTSTTFQIAETKELAIAGTAVDLTSQTENVFLWMYDLKDYGASYTGKTGAIAFFGTGKDWYTHIIGGTTLKNSADNDTETMFMAVPFLDSVSSFVLPKLFLESTTETIKSLTVKHRPLDVHDKIIVKVKNVDYLNVPTSSVITVSSQPANWTSSDEFYTGCDLNEIKTLFDAGEEIEVEFISGVGAGQMVKLTGIDYSAGTYAITLAEDVIGASAGLKSHFVMDNWKVCAEVDFDTQKEGVFNVPIAKSSKAPQLKFELRGIGTAIEDIQIINNSQTK